MIIEFDPALRTRQLMEILSHFPIGIAVLIAIGVVAIGYHSKYRLPGRRDHSVDSEELRTFDEGAALEQWKRDHEQDS